MYVFYIGPGKNAFMDIAVINKSAADRLTKNFSPSYFVHYTQRNLHILKQNPCENFRTLTYSLHI